MTTRRFITTVGLVAMGCDTLTDLPAIVSVVERGPPVVLVNALNDTLPLPLPDPLTVIHVTGLVAFHVQPVAAVTVMVPLTVLPAGDSDIGATV